MKKMRRYLLGTGLLAIIGLSGACAHDKYESARKTGKEVGEAVTTKVYFADQLSLLDKKEIALGKLALKRSSNIGVRTFAQQLVENHEKQQDTLEKYADASALRLATIHLSTEEGLGGAGREGAKEAYEKHSAKYEEKLDKKIEDSKQEIQKLSAMSGPEFDKAFLEQVREDQKHGKKLADQGLKEYGDDAALALLLGRSVPVFDRQAEQAKTLSGTIR